MILQEIFLAQNHAAQAAALAVDIFGRGMHDDIGAELHRPLQRGPGEGIVHDQLRAGLVARSSPRRCRSTMRKRGIGRRLQEQHPRFRPHRRCPLRDIVAVHQRVGDAEARQDFFDHIAAGAEHRLGGHDMIAGSAAQQRNVAVTAAMPLAVARATGAPSSAAMRASNMDDGGIAEAGIVKPSAPLKRASASSAVS